MRYGIVQSTDAVGTAPRGDPAVATALMKHEQPGTVRETYGTALRLGEATPEPDDLVVAVKPRPANERDRPLTDTHVDVGDALVPPKGLRFDLDRALDRLEPDDAWTAVDYESRYRTFLESDPEAHGELARIRRHLAAGGTVWFVCPGNTPEQRRHRAILRDVVEASVRDDGGTITG